jgi:hypothetical protein
MRFQKFSPEFFFHSEILPASKHQRESEKRVCIHTSSTIADDDELEGRVIYTLLSRNGL